MYHGSHNEIGWREQAHVGICLTDDIDAARRYAGALGKVYEVELDLSSLVCVEVDGYDHDTNVAPGDASAAKLAVELDCDVIVYEDEDELGRSHRTWRLLTAAAVDAASVELFGCCDPDECQCEEGCDVCCG